MSVEQQVINNVFFMIAIEGMCKKNNKTIEQYEQMCIEKDTCLCIVSEIKTSPYFFNKNGKGLVAMLLDTKTLKVRPLAKNGKTKVLNTEKNRLIWG